MTTPRLRKWIKTRISPKEKRQGKWAQKREVVPAKYALTHLVSHLAKMTLSRVNPPTIKNSNRNLLELQAKINDHQASMITSLAQSKCNTTKKGKNSIIYRPETTKIKHRANQFPCYQTTHPRTTSPHCWISMRFYLLPSIPDKKKRNWLR